MTTPPTAGQGPPDPQGDPWAGLNPPLQPGSNLGPGPNPWAGAGEQRPAPGPWSYPAPAPPPRRSYKKLIIILSVVGVLILVVCCGAGVKFVSTVGDDLTAPTKSAVTFLDTLKAKDYDSAYGQMCASAKSHQTPEQFRHVLATFGTLTSYSIGGVNVRSGTGGTAAYISVRDEWNNGTIRRDGTIRLVKEGTWKVCDFDA